MSLEDQQEVIDFLSRPRAYGRSGGPVERIDTHISVVFLVGERAYKLKRAVTFDFLDFSTLARRRQACEAELSLNRRTAPDLYLRLVAVRRRPDGALALGGEGTALEWLVEMKRFDQQTLFDRLARAGALTPSLITKLAHRIAALHEGAERRRDHGGRDGMAAVLRGLEKGLARVEQGASSQAAGHLLVRLEGELERHGDLLEARRANGFVRHCHGDLHLGNVCLLEGEPTLFDAIEFNERIACIDVLYDLAFPVMDLWHHGLRDLANRLFNYYLGLSADIEGLPAFPLFLSARAAVRAHVLALNVHGPRAITSERERIARGYLAAAAALSEPVPARLLAVGGLSGSGKSTLARRLAPNLGRTPGALVLRSDVIRKRLLGRDLDARLGPEGYSPALSARVYREIGARAASALEAGQTVIADAVYARPDERDALEEIARRRGVPFLGLWLSAPPEVLASRIGGRRADVSDATVAVLEKQLDYPIGDMSWRELDAGGSPDGVEKRARYELARGEPISD
jgi:aminoglycoside phosphotransferase family enzyme/predicted kinase